MKYIKCAMFVLSLFSSIYSMEIVPFLKKENKIPLVHYVVKLLPEKAQSTTVNYIMKLSGLGSDKKQEIDLLQQKIHIFSENMCQYSDKMHMYGNVARGAAAGICGGCMSGTTVISTYGIVDGCVWCWCNATIPKITCNMMVGGLSSCGCIGCIVGSCCVATRYVQKTGCISS